MTTAPETSHTERLAAARAEGAGTPTTSQKQQLIDDIHTIVEEALAKRDLTAGPPPHVIVTCDEDRLAFGRFALLQMDYDTAVDTFLEEFLVVNDIKLDAKIFATFWRLHGNSDSGPVRIHRSSWKELILNVTQIKVVIEVADDVVDD